MLLIVAHHYVVNSDLFQILPTSPHSATSAVMLLFGAWGKTGIDCFVLITGYFMCRQSFSWQKLLKLYLQITFYVVVIYGIFCITGHEKFSPFKAAMTLFPVKSISDGFGSCFILFYLFIPFLNIFIKALSKREHAALVMLTLVMYTLLPSGGIRLTFNYVSWFGVLYLIASYIRLYGFSAKITHRMWGVMTILTIIAGAASILGLFGIYRFEYTSKFAPYYFISDSNKILALAISLCSFMWFKDLRIPYSRLINTIGATTFGILLIHANSDAMRQWLWRETVDCVGHFGDSLLWTLGYAILSVLIIFTVCSGIDWFRGKLIEPWLTNAFTKIISSAKTRLPARLFA